jgi:hypothetical protein
VSRTPVVNMLAPTTFDAMTSHFVVLAEPTPSAACRAMPPAYHEMSDATVPQCAR